MKKLAILLLTVLISGGLYAQLPSFGIKAAATASSINTADLASSFESNNLLGYQIGAFVRLGSGKLYLQPEFVYNHRSTKLVDFTGMDLNFDIGTIDVPVLVGFKLVDAKVFNLRAFVGPEASFATSATYSKDSASPIKLADFNELTWYMQAGVGVDLLFLTFDVRYEKGLNNFLDDAKDLGVEGGLKNSVIVFSLGLKFM